MSRVAIRTLNILDATLKRDALLFDHVAFDPDAYYRVRRLMEKIYGLLMDREFALTMLTQDESELAFLLENDVLIPQRLSDILGATIDVPHVGGLLAQVRDAQPQVTDGDVRMLAEWIAAHFINRREDDELLTRTPAHGDTSIFGFLTRLHEHETHDAELLSVLQQALDPNSSYTPILTDAQLVSPAPALKTKRVAEIVLARFPRPVQDAAWEDILEFRNDSENRRRLLALRQWMAKAVSSSRAVPELEEELEYLVLEHERALKLARLKYETDTLEVVIVTLAEVLENVLKLNWSAAARKWFDIRRRDVDFLIKEGELEAKDVAYLTKMSETFPRSLSECG